MPTFPVIGFIHNGTTVAGLISHLRPGQWANPRKVNSAFGVYGAAVIDGALSIREIAMSMIYMGGFTSYAERDASIMLLELNIGQVGELAAWTPAEQILQIESNARLASIVWGRAGVDYLHGYWRQMDFVFEQLEPPSPDDEDEEDETEDE